MEDLKNYENKLIYFIIFNISLFFIINFDFKKVISYQDIISLILTVPILYLPTYFINNITDTEKKFKILYPCIPNHRFAYNIFTKMETGEIKYNKRLIDIDLIKKFYGPFKDGIEEDALWYQLYNKYKYDQKIFEQNRQFLLCRDFTAMIIPFTLLYLLVAFWIRVPLNNIHYIIIATLLEFFAFRKLAEMHNEKFAKSVLQEETSILKKYKHQTRLSDFNK